MTELQYLQSNPIINSFVNMVDEKRKEYFSTGSFAQNDYWKINERRLKIRISVGTKFIKLISDGSAWGFIARQDGSLHGVPYRRGDLFKPANWRSPAKHARGNIIDGTAKWDVYGPSYLY